MNFFTRDLLARTRSSDPAVADAASVEWEDAARAYRRFFREVALLLPDGVYRVHERIDLEGAEVISASACDDEPRFSLFVRLSDGGVAELIYETAGCGVVARHPAGSRPVIAADEFDLAEGGGFVHRLLLEGGGEVEVGFVNLRAQRLRFIRPDALGAA